MQHYWSLEELSLQNAWVTIGSFDGVHLGHQAIIRSLTAGAQAAGAPAVVLTFFPHPAVVLGKRQDPFYLSTPEEKAALLGELGADVIVTHPFNRDVAAMSAPDFMARLQHHLGMQRLFVGYDFALGRGRSGDVPTLRRLGEELGYVLEVISPIRYEGEVVSSSRIRDALREGRVDLAARLLGRPYWLDGEVVHGDQRGRSIGIPTANLEVWAERAIPRAGVYVCRAFLKDGSGHPGPAIGAVTNVGVRPTFETGPVLPRVEAHLLDFEGDLYGKQLGLEFLSRLRDEQRFPSVTALVEQIHQDIAQGRAVLNS